MPTRAPTALLASMLLSACASGGGLGYGVPAAPSVAYQVGDTLTIAIQGLGQTLEIGARSDATYALSYEPVSGATRISVGIERLSAEVVTSLTEPMAMDEGALDGPFIFDVDERGRVQSMSSPAANDLGGQVFASSAPLLAHALFPRLPGGAVDTGDSWTDAVEYRQTTEAGETELLSSLTYTVMGDAAMDGRPLLEIAFSGTATVSQELSLEGANITHSSESEVEGRVLWDTAAGLVYSSELSMEGPGSVRAALLPAALPARVTWRTRVRLQAR